MRQNHDEQTAIRKAYFHIGLFWLLVVLAMGLVAHQWYALEEKDVRDALGVELSHHLEAGEDHMQRDLTQAASLLLALADSHMIQSLLAGSSDLDSDADLHTVFAPILSQLEEFRLLDRSGVEIIRIRRNGQGGLQSVPSTALQSRAGSECFLAARDIPPGRIYLAPVSESGQMQSAPQSLPLMRMAMPVYAPGPDSRDASVNKPLGLAVLILNGKGLYWHHDDSPLQQIFSLRFVDEGFVYRMHAGEVTVSATAALLPAVPGGLSRTAEMHPAEFLPLAERQAALAWKLSESVPASLLAARLEGVRTRVWVVWGAAAVWAGVFLFGMAMSRKKNLILDGERQRLLAEVQGLSRRLMSLREGDERELAVSLHDEVGQALAAVQMRLSVLAEDCARDACDAAPRVSQEAAYIAQAMEVLRGHLRALRPPQLDVLGLGEALRALAEAMQRKCGWQLDQEIGSGLERLDEAVSLGAYRLVKEALQNVARHASASCVKLQIHIVPDGLLILIEDDGIGFDSGLAHAGFGLISMRERAALLGGEMQVDTAPGKGARLSFLLPLDAPTEL